MPRPVLKPYWQTTDRRLVRLYQGDVLQVLSRLPSGSVQCVMTSPPYWGLRDYGIDSQLGLEPTPEEYVAKMVEVFREVRRVLRDDGTLFPNLGSSYASGGMSPSPSPLLWRAPAYDNSDTESQYSQDDGRVCSDFDGELQDETAIRHGRNARIDRCVLQDEPQTSQTGHGSGREGCDQESLYSSQLDVPESTTQQSSELPSDASFPSTMVSVCQPEKQTVSPSSPPSERNLACTDGTSQMSQPLVVRTQGKEFFFSACQRSDCKGVGKCGLCWCSLAIPSLEFKAKDEVNTPHLVAIALQADGWSLRQTIIFAKPSPMPESVTDRCTKAHEYVFLLTKRPRYYWDAEAIAERSIDRESLEGRRVRKRRKDHTEAGEASVGAFSGDRSGFLKGRSNDEGRLYPTRNKRSIWTIPSEAYPGAHFATFPRKLVEPCLLAGTSAYGACAECGAPYRRVLESTKLTRPRPNEYVKRTGQPGTGNSCANSVAGVENRTLGWEPTCECKTDKVVPCTVLDPFCGSGTVSYVAVGLGLRSIGIDLSEKYLRNNAIPRIEGALVSTPALNRMLPDGRREPVELDGERLQVQSGF